MKIEFEITLRCNAKCWSCSRHCPYGLYDERSAGRCGASMPTSSRDTSVSDTCIVNYSSGWFIKGQNRLKQACLDVGYQGDFLLFNDDNPLQCPPHSRVPYGFKPWSMKAAQALGYRYILWCDASVYPERPLDAVWELLREKGYMFLQCGHNCGTWCTDVALEVLGIDRELAFTLPQFIGGCQALDMQNELAKKYLDRWFELANDGLSFHGDWTNERGQVSKDPRVKGHRHDQSIGSLIAYQLGMTDFKGNWLIYDEAGRTPRREETIFIVRSAYGNYIERRYVSL